VLTKETRQLRGRKNSDAEALRLYSCINDIAGKYRPLCLSLCAHFGLQMYLLCRKAFLVMFCTVKFVLSARSQTETQPHQYISIRVPPFSSLAHRSGHHHLTPGHRRRKEPHRTRPKH
jgi:hypothetical protein